MGEQGQEWYTVKVEERVKMKGMRNARSWISPSTSRRNPPCSHLILSLVKLILDVV